MIYLKRIFNKCLSNLGMRHQFYLVHSQTAGKKKRSRRLVVKNCENISKVEELFLGIKCSSLFPGKEEVYLCQV